jgi:hypothetical protein
MIPIPRGKRPDWGTGKRARLEVHAAKMRSESVTLRVRSYRAKPGSKRNMNAWRLRRAEYLQRKGEQ